jgi:hypothetical protein
MKHLHIGLTIAFALTTASPTAAQPYPEPVTVYPTPPPPPVVIGQAVGGGIVSLPFQFLGGLLGVPQVPLIPDGYGGWVSATNSRYDPVTGQFLPPETYVYQEP